MNTLFLCPAIQNEILFSGDHAINALTEFKIRPLLREVHWDKQLTQWQALIEDKKQPLPNFSSFSPILKPIIPFISSYNRDTKHEKLIGDQEIKRGPKEKISRGIWIVREELICCWKLGRVFYRETMSLFDARASALRIQLDMFPYKQASREGGHGCIRRLSCDYVLLLDDLYRLCCRYTEYHQRISICRRTT